MKKVLVSVGLFALSWCVLAWLGNPLFATVLLALLSVHEAGHLAFMWKYGIPLKGLYFIPLLGALIVPGDRIRSRPSGVAITLGGPLFGLASALLALGAYALWPSPEAASAAYIAALINAFNMLPVFPLDGGQALAYALDDGKRSHVKIGKTLWMCYFFGLSVLMIGFQNFFVTGLIGYYGYRGIKAYLTEISRREDGKAVRQALAEAIGTSPETVLEAIEAPFDRIRQKKEPRFPEAFLRDYPGLHFAEGLRRIEWCVPEDAAISDGDVDFWTGTLDDQLVRNASRAYASAVADKARKAVAPRRIAPFSTEMSVTYLDELDPYTPLEDLPSPLRRYLTQETVPASSLADGRHGRLAYFALAAALAATTAICGIVSGWSYTGLL